MDSSSHCSDSGSRRSLKVRSAEFELSWIICPQGVLLQVRAECRGKAR